MAVYLSIQRISETPSVAEYAFSTTDGREGSFRISKGDGEVTLLRSMPDDPDGNLFARAAYKIKKHWESGSLPVKTTWAS